MDSTCSFGSQMIDPAEGFSQFVAIVEEGSISAAARALDVPRATLSRRLASLEASLGVKLLHRSTRRLVPTPAGVELYRRTRRILQDAREAREAVRRLDGVPRGRLKLAVPPVMGGALEPLLNDYMVRYPETQVEVVAGSRFVDLLAEDIDVAIRAGRINDPTLVTLQIAQTDVFPVASPAYLELFGRPSSPQELSQHQCLVDYEKGDVARRYWPLKAGERVAIGGRFSSNDLGMLLAMALKGWGIAMLPFVVTQSSLKRGRLVPVLRDAVGYQSPLSLIHPSQDFMEPKVREFLNLAVPYFETHLDGR